MDTPIDLILEKYFFSFIDQGLKQPQTPLFLGIYKSNSLRDAIAVDFPRLEIGEINQLILCARQEVAL